MIMVSAISLRNPFELVDMSYSAQTDKALTELRNGNPRGLESVIRFLEGDEYRFGSGYLKQRAWHYLKRAALTDGQKRRLCNVALQYLRQPMKREFSYMCKYMAGAATSEFRMQVEQLT